MPISKPDFNLIFASQAPSQDLPAAFNNYARGWDEARKNNGKPTIKQFNYLIQQLDLKALWMIQNGAALPFDETVDYADGAISVKDGLIKQKSGASWVIPFMRGSQNLAELTDVAQARTKLDVYSKSEALSKDNNLSELVDKAAARTNLNVYSKAETDAIAGTPNATETTAGKAEIATQYETNVATDDTRFVTPKKLLAGLKYHLNASGNAPIYACRAWVNFSGTGAVAIRDSGNVSSITDNGTGNYTINFTTNMQDSNYSLVVSAGRDSTTSGNFATIEGLTTSGAQILVRSGSNIDSATVCAGVFR